MTDHHEGPDHFTRLSSLRYTKSSLGTDNIAVQDHRRANYNEQFFATRLVTGATVDQGDCFGHSCQIYLDGALPAYRRGNPVPTEIEECIRRDREIVGDLMLNSGTLLRLRLEDTVKLVVGQQHDEVSVASLEELVDFVKTNQTWWEAPEIQDYATTFNLTVWSAQVGGLTQQGNPHVYIQVFKPDRTTLRLRPSSSVKDDCTPEELKGYWREFDEQRNPYYRAAGKRILLGATGYHFEPGFQGLADRGRKSVEGFLASQAWKTLNLEGIEDRGSATFFVVARSAFDASGNLRAEEQHWSTKEYVEEGEKKGEEEGVEEGAEEGVEEDDSMLLDDSAEKMAEVVELTPSERRARERNQADLDAMNKEAQGKQVGQLIREGRFADSRERVPAEGKRARELREAAERTIGATPSSESTATPTSAAPTRASSTISTTAIPNPRTLPFASSATSFAGQPQPRPSSRARQPTSSSISEEKTIPPRPSPATDSSNSAPRYPPRRPTDTLQLVKLVFGFMNSSRICWLNSLAVALGVNPRFYRLVTSSDREFPARSISQQLRLI